MFRFEHEAHLVPLSRAIGLACVAVIMVLSLLPADERPHTGSSGQLEHTVAYFGTAVFLAAGFRKRQIELQRSFRLSDWLLPSS
jgi:hypothetical protein